MPGPGLVQIRLAQLFGLLPFGGQSLIAFLPQPYGGQA